MTSGTGDDGKLAPSFSTGEDKEITVLSSPLTPKLRIAENLFVMVWVRPNPPHSAKDVTLTLEFECDDTRVFLLGNAVYPVNKDGVY
jgi:hypothetical protein